jgi:hypothetical protein
MLKPIILSIWFLLHPVHVSITSIDYVPELDSFKVFVRMYFDDFITDCKLTGVEVTESNFLIANSSSKNIMEDYLCDKVRIIADEKLLTCKLVDLKLADNEISMNMVYKGVNKPKSVKVLNNIMTALYSDQSNMVILRVNNYEEGAKLTSDAPERIFNTK